MRRVYCDLPDANDQHYSFGSDLPGRYPYADGNRSYKLHLEPGVILKYNQWKCCRGISYYDYDIHVTGSRIRHLYRYRFYHSERNTKSYYRRDSFPGQHLPRNINRLSSIRSNILYLEPCNSTQQYQYGECYRIADHDHHLYCHRS